MILIKNDTDDRDLFCDLGYKERQYKFHTDKYFRYNKLFYLDCDEMKELVTSILIGKDRTNVSNQ